MAGGQRWRWASLGAWLVASACDVALMRGVPREQALGLAAELDRNGVVAHLVPDGASRLRLDVNQAAVSDAVAALLRTSAAASCQSASDEPASPWLETTAEARSRDVRRLEAALATTLVRLPHVMEARVHVTLPHGIRAVPESQSQAAASVLLVRSEAQAAPPVANAARETVAGAIPGLAASAVHVVETRREQALPALEFARVGPIVVKRDSAATLKLWLAGALLLQLLLAAALLRPLLRRRGNG